MRILLQLLAFALPIALAAPARAEASPTEVRLFKAKCASCHGADGKAQTENGKKLGIPDMAGADWQKAHTDAQLKDILTSGKPVKANGKEQPHFTAKLNPPDVDALIRVVRSFAK